jgi:hypothetical protein
MFYINFIVASNYIENLKHLRNKRLKTISKLQWVTATKTLHGDSERIPLYVRNLNHPNPT